MRLVLLLVYSDPDIAFAVVRAGLGASDDAAS